MKVAVQSLAELLRILLSQLQIVLDILNVDVYYNTVGVFFSHTFIHDRRTCKRVELYTLAITD